MQTFVIPAMKKGPKSVDKSRHREFIHRFWALPPAGGCTEATKLVPYFAFLEKTTMRDLGPVNVGKQSLGDAMRKVSRTPRQ